MQYNKLNAYLPLIIFIFLVIIFLFLLQKESEGGNQFTPLIGQPLPAFEGENLQGRLIHSKDFLSSCPVLINVWATWCPTCYIEHRFLMKLSAEGVPVMSVIYKDSLPSVKDWLKSGDPYRLHIMDNNGGIAIKLGVYGTPETFLVDCEGIIREKRIGVMNQSVWDEQFKHWFDS